MLRVIKITKKEKIFQAIMAALVERNRTLFFVDFEILGLFGVTKANSICGVLTENVLLRKNKLRCHCNKISWLKKCIKFLTVFVN